MKRSKIKKGTIKSILISVVAITVLLYIVVPEPEAPLPKVDNDSLRVLKSGKIIGFSSSKNGHAWFGIPFAEPPIDNLRWRAPQDVTPWTGTKQMLRSGRSCVQLWDRITGEDGDFGDIAGSEDCLTLNVFAPAYAANAIPSGENKLPVMYWIHGGGNTIGSGSVFEGGKIATEQNVILVSINYRLGIFGWFTHPALHNEQSSLLDRSGNYGTLDIIQGLRWVQNNIANFGGDPNNVTIFGESAGGRNIYSLLASKEAKGLFHKGIIQSGSARSEDLLESQKLKDESLLAQSYSSKAVLLSLFKAENPDLTEQQLLTQLDTATNEELAMRLNSASASELMASIRPFALQGTGMYLSPNVLRDGQVVASKPFLEIVKNGEWYHQVPLILGSNRDEQKLFANADPRFTDNKLWMFPRIIDLEGYNRNTAYFSDAWKALAVDYPAALFHERGQKNIYTYRFDWDDSPSNFFADLPNLIGAAHGVEVAFVFGDFEGSQAFRFLFNDDNKTDAERLSKEMRNYWAEFARTGNPGNGNSEQQATWTAWQPSGTNNMILDSTPKSTMQPSLHTEQSLKQRLANDQALSQQTRCQYFAQLFLFTYQSDVFWNPVEYQQFADGGCSDYEVQSFKP